MLRIAITGGPCAGKSTIQGRLIQLLESHLNMKVFWVPESATELILNGIVPGEQINIVEFQKFVLEKQLAKEALYEKAARYYDPNKTIIFYDRGIMDAAAYVPISILEKMLQERKITLSEAYNRYDAALHLVTAADGAEAFYEWNDPSKEGTGNNAARRETPEEARVADQKTREAWIGHPHLRIFDNSTSFEEKMNRVVKEVFSLLGEPEPLEIEKKYLVRKPSEEEILALGYTSKTNIIQTYLHQKGNAERRVRQRGTKESGYTFYYTEKVDVTSGHGQRIEREKKITQREYLNYLMDADTSFHQISKERYCFIHENRYFELDVFPFSKEYAILEVELNDEIEKVTLPNLEMIREVTEDKRYRNYSLAKTLSLV